MLKVKPKVFETRADKKARLLAMQRDNVFLPVRLDLLRAAAARGMDDELICVTYGCSPELFSKWLKLYPSMLEALREGRAECDFQVESAMHKRATGYEYDEEAPTKNGAVTIRKHMPADVSAGKYWLGNRRSGKWRDRTVVDVNAIHEVTDKRAIIDDIVRMLSAAPGGAQAALTLLPAIPTPVPSDAATSRLDGAGEPLEAHAQPR